MDAIRANDFIPERKKMPVINESDISSDFPFFDYFESSAINMPKETDYYPIPVNKEKV